MAAKKTFEEKLDRLEKIADDMQMSEVSLQKSVELFSEGIELIGQLNEELDAAEEKIKILIEKNGEIKAEDF